MSYRYTFTVFTPTYNRAHTLPRVYESLRAQTFRDFEWLIVDDGSKDNTRQLVEGWQAINEIPIRYVYQQNQGKPGACNRATQEAQGELLLTLDSDDAALPHGLERLKYYWDAIPSGEKHRFSAVSGLCQDQHGNLVGNKFPKDIWDTDTVELTFLHDIQGDKWGFQRTDVFKEFPFRTSPTHNPRFNCEGLTYLELSRKYKTRFVNEVLKVYYVPDGTGDQLSNLDPVTMTGPALYHQYILDELNYWFWRTPWKLFRSAINFSRYSFGMGRSASAQLKELRSSFARFLVTLALPLGYAMSLRERRKA
jgi:glycosyltransferase involved in cell wall biosynthesis